MDVLAHGIWTAVAFNGLPRQTQVRAVLWGLAPDLIPTTVTVLSLPLTGLGFEHLAFRYVYPFTHSLILFGMVLFISTMVLRRVPLSMLAWALHVILDIPGHRRFLTPFLFPFFDYRIMGLWEWLSPRMLLVNYTAMAIVLTLLWLRRRKRLRMQAVVS